jgi:exodeoxyribonuclease V gamma subunit
VGTGLFVYTSNRLEELAEALATVLDREPLPPLATETVLVPSQGLARWLRQQLARRFDVAAGLALPFPGAWLRQLDRTAAADPFDDEVLRLRVWRLLGAPAARTRFAAAAEYCADDPDQQKRWQLANRLARTLDDYQLYRPELLERWAAGDDVNALGPDAAWQAALWRELRHDAGIAPAAPASPPRGRRSRPAPAGPLLFPELAAPPPPADTSLRVRRLRQLFADRARTLAVVPHRVSVFGAGTLPPAVLDLLGALAAHVEVHLFVPAPTALYTGDARERDADGNSLFLRLCTEAREFADLVADLCERLGARARATFDLAAMARRAPVAAAAPLLPRLQQDLAELRARRPGGDGDDAPLPLDPDDRSLRVHVCHSPQRELEVVRDQLLAAFRDDPTLEPHDVLVLVPDIAAYAPFAHAVFGPVREHLPFHVADKSPAADLPLCAALLAVLQLAQQRLEVHDVLHLLEQPAVQQRFSIFAADLPVLRARCEQAGIRWGLDGTARERQFGVPAFDDNAWRPGLHRLLLGVATGAVDELVDGVLPAAGATASGEPLLARFVCFAETLFAQLAGLLQPQPPAQWADRLDGVLAALFAPTSAEDRQALELVRSTLARLRAHAAAAKCTEPMHRGVLASWLEDALGNAPGARGFLAGAVTVAALLPMRAVPVRRLFVCGLDDASFPRRDRPVPFDLIAAHRRPGDRSVRLDDRQMFVDVLLAARETLHLSYVGRSQKDNSVCAPSPVLDELLAHVDRACVLPDGRPARAHVVVEHPLQPWSPRYRDGSDPRLFTFARADLEPDAAGLVESPWCAGALVVPAELRANELSLAQLEEFWNHPSRFFLKRVANVSLRRPDDPDDPTEPFVLDSLRRWQLQNELVQRSLRGLAPRADPFAHARATGTLPVGARGVLAYADAQAETDGFLARLRAHGPMAPRAIDVEVAGVRVCGEVDVAANHVVFHRVSGDGAKHRLRAWIRHVFASAMRHRDARPWPEATVWVSRKRDIRFAELGGDEALHHAATLVEGYRQGLASPLPMLTTASCAYGRALRDGKNPDACRRIAATAYAGRDVDWPDGDEGDPDVALCWRGRDPLADPGFPAWAERLWLPIHARSDK